MTLQPVSVTQLTQYMKQLLDHDEVLSQVCVRGELSNYKMHSSGHHYFTLKDDGAVISCVMFRSDASRLRFRPESGMKVILSGRVSLFPKSGQYQIYVSNMQPDGIGALYVAFEQLKNRLLQEGLFDNSHKKPLPEFPRTIALVTSPTGAAVRDMIRILGQRYPLAKVLVCPVRVQGVGAAEEIAAMLSYVNQWQLADVILTGRGGGSLEDLWAFNEEIVARAIYQSEIPVISAVGHEPDVTISDFVADVRAATPSNAAELAVCDSMELTALLQGMDARLRRAESQLLRQKRQTLQHLAASRALREPETDLREKELLCAMLQQRLERAGESRMSREQQRFAQTAAKLDALSPLKVLARGYSMVTKETGVVKQAAELDRGDRIEVRFQDGRANCVVEETRLEDNRNG